jgi:TnpA family transposase
VPGRVFTETERRRLGAFPSEISEPDLIRYFTLSVSNLEFVRQQRGDHNRLGFALQLCALRYLGFCPDDIATTPSAAIAFVSDQLQVAPGALHAYGARPQTRTGHLQQIQRHLELEALLRRFDEELPRHPSLRIEDESLVVGPLDAADKPPSLVALEDLIDARLPLVELPDLLMEVDGWTGFSRHLEHAGGAEPRAPELLVHCHASILAQACNFGLTRMAQLADLSYRQLAWCTTWYLREETLKPAIASIVDRHYRHPLAQLWGGGILSSSDGQRFPMAVRSQTATAIPRYFGYGRGLTFYTWTSDQFSQYGSKPIPSTVRDATYVLDGILDNETELPIAEHTSDTAGYTDLVFSLFDLLGLQFSPRLRDLGDQKLYRIDRGIRYQHIGPLIRGRYDEEQLNQVSCLNLVTNAVVLWNTVYLSAVLDQLRTEDHNVDDGDVVHLSPARYAHINPYGKYRFNVEGEFHRKGLRPLRRPDSVMA